MKQILLFWWTYFDEINLDEINFDETILDDTNFKETDILKGKVQCVHFRT